MLRLDQLMFVVMQIPLTSISAGVGVHLQHILREREGVAPTEFVLAWTALSAAGAVAELVNATLSPGLSRVQFLVLLTGWCVAANWVFQPFASSDFLAVALLGRTPTLVASFALYGFTHAFLSVRVASVFSSIFATEEERIAAASWKQVSTTIAIIGSGAGMPALAGPDWADVGRVRVLIAFFSLAIVVGVLVWQDRLREGAPTARPVVPGTAGRTSGSKRPLLGYLASDFFSALANGVGNSLFPLFARAAARVAVEPVRVLGFELPPRAHFPLLSATVFLSAACFNPLWAAFLRRTRIRLPFLWCGAALYYASVLGVGLSLARSFQALWLVAVLQGLAVAAFLILPELMIAELASSSPSKSTGGAAPSAVISSSSAVAEDEDASRLDSSAAPPSDAPATERTSLQSHELAAQPNLLRHRNKMPSVSSEARIASPSSSCAESPPPPSPVTGNAQQTSALAADPPAPALWTLLEIVSTRALLRRLANASQAWIVGALLVATNVPPFEQLTALVRAGPAAGELAHVTRALLVGTAILPATLNALSGVSIVLGLR